MHSPGLLRSGINAKGSEIGAGLQGNHPNPDPLGLSGRVEAVRGAEGEPTDAGDSGGERRVQRASAAQAAVSGRWVGERSEERRIRSGCVDESWSWTSF